MRNQVFPIAALFFSRDNPMPIAFFLSTALYQQLHTTIGIRKQKFSIPKTNKKKDISTPLARILRTHRPRALSHTYHIKNSSFNDDYGKLQLPRSQRTSLISFKAAEFVSPSRQAFQLVTTEASNSRWTAHGHIFWCGTRLLISKINYFHMCPGANAADTLAITNTELSPTIPTELRMKSKNGSDVRWQGLGA